MIAFRLPVFARRAKRATVRRPKFYFFDAGVYRRLRPVGPLDRPEETHGPALEGLVVQHLRAWVAYRNSDDRLYYWRTRSGVEVDFVVYGPDQFWVIEVKNTSRIHRNDLRSLRAFREDYPDCRTLMLYRGRDRLAIDGIPCFPCEQFLRQVHPSRDLLDE